MGSCCPNCHGLTSITLNEGLKEIFNSAFAGCKEVTEVTIPKSVTSIGICAFGLSNRYYNGEPIHCDKLNKVTVLWDDPLQIDESVFMDDNYEKATLYVPVGTKEKYKGATGWKNFINISEIGEQPEEPEEPELPYADGEVLYATNADNLQIKYKVISVKERTCQIGGFDGTNTFTEESNAVPRDTRGSVVIPSEVNGLKVTQIGTSAFYECKYITSITIPETVTTINQVAFWSCHALSSIHIPASVVKIDNAPAVFCPALSTITVSEQNPVYDSRENCNAIIETNSNKLIQGCQTTVIPSSVTSLGTNSFSGHYGLREVTIPSSISSIGVNAFQNCFYLEKVISYVEVPFEVSNDAFGVGWDSENNSYLFPQTLYVPKGTKDMYLATNHWNLFSEIIEMEDVLTSVSTFPSPQRSVECYNIGAQRVVGFKKGLNIVRMSDGTIKKILVK